jgi:bacitracin synthase 3
VLPLSEDINKDKLKTALNELIERHESLRTSFEEINGLPIQRIHPGISIGLDYYEAGKEEVLGMIKDYIRPFDLSRAPLVRSAIIKLPDKQHVWIVDIHHIVSDGASHSVLTGDFISLYNKQKPKPLKLQYKDFSEWQKKYLQKDEIKSQESYWLNLFAGEIPELHLPVDFERPDRFTFAGDLYSLKINKENAAELKKMTAAFGGTIFLNVLTILNVLFYKYTGQDDIIVGTGMAGRQHDDLRDIIGLFVNPLPMRNYPAADKTYGDFFREVIHNSIKAFENQDVQFERLVDMLNLKRDSGKSPLFSVVLVGLNFSQPGENVLGAGKNYGAQNTEEVRNGELPFKGKHISAQADMVFNIREVGEEIYINIEYYTALFNRETIASMACDFLEILKLGAADWNIKLKDIEVFPTSEKKYINPEILETKRQISESFDF